VFQKRPKWEMDRILDVRISLTDWRVSYLLSRRGNVVLGAFISLLGIAAIAVVGYGPDLLK
jgi:hypothetical protein